MVTRTASLVAAASATAWMAIASPFARAETTVLPTVESMTADAVAIVDATVVDSKPPPPTVTRRPAGAHTLILTISQKIFGNISRPGWGDAHAPWLLEIVDDGPVLPNGTRVVVFVREGKVGSSCGRDPSTGVLEMFVEWQAAAVLRWPGGDWQLATRDFAVVSERDRLVAAVEAQLARRAFGRHAILPAPANSAAASLVSGGEVALLVPTDDALERQAEAGLAAVDGPTIVASLQAIAPFESLDHIALVLRLLRERGGDDPSIAAAARAVLARWEVPAE